jgi:hypothetical protein
MKSWVKLMANKDDSVFKRILLKAITGRTVCELRPLPVIEVKHGFVRKHRY